jgi:hypothetical protein
VSNVVIEALTDRRKFFLASIIRFALLVSFGAGFFQRSKILLQLRHATGQERIALFFRLLDFLAEFFFEFRNLTVASFIVHINNHVSGEINNLLEVFRCHIQQVAQAARNTLEIPDVGNRCGQLNVTHALTTNGGLGDLHATTLTDDAFEAHPLVLSTRTLPVTTGSKDLLTEKAILFRLERPVVDVLGLLYFTMRPATNVFGCGQANAKGVKRCCFQHD